MEVNGQDNQQTSRPPQVTVAVYLIYASLTVTVLHALLNPAAVGQAATEITPRLFFTLACAITTLFPIFLAIKINAGRNWARQLYSVAVFLNIFYVVDLLQSFDEYPLLTIFGTIPLLFQITTIVLLFQGPSNAWFRSDKSAARSQSEPDAELAAKEDKLPSEGAAGSRSGDKGARAIPQLRNLAIAAAVGAGIGLMNGLFWTATLPPQSESERQLIIFLILGGLLLGATLGAVSGFLLLQFARQNPNRTPALWAAMGGIIGGVFSFGCCFFMMLLSFV